MEEDDSSLVSVLKAYKAHSRGKLGQKVAPIEEENFIWGRKPLRNVSEEANQGPTPAAVAAAQERARSNEAFAKMASIMESQSQAMAMQSPDVSWIVRAVDNFMLSQAYPPQ